jgi:hypothetical protein
MNRPKSRTVNYGRHPLFLLFHGGSISQLIWKSNLLEFCPVENVAENSQKALEEGKTDDISISISSHNMLTYEDIRPPRA